MKNVIQGNKISNNEFKKIIKNYEQDLNYEKYAYQLVGAIVYLVSISMIVYFLFPTYSNFNTYLKRVLIFNIKGWFAIYAIFFLTAFPIKFVTRRFLIPHEKYKNWWKNFTRYIFFLYVFLSMVILFFASFFMSFLIKY